MKKYLSLIALALLTVFSTVKAGTVTLSDAQSVALNFFKVTYPNLNNPSLAATLKYTKSEPDNAVDFYVFDISPSNGFVIVSGDDNIIPIIGYSAESNFRTDFSHVGLSNWMKSTAARISDAVQHNATADARIQDLWSSYRAGLNPNTQRSGGAGPLCVTRWDQEMDTTTSPPPFLYNLFCPYNAADTERCVTGCVATAMAQVMKYWNYPAQGTGSFSYVDDVANGYSNNYGTQSSDFASHIYQWSLMPTELMDSSAPSEDTAVGQLMYDCGVSVGMDYGDDKENGSGANALLFEELQYGDSFCSQYALPKYFGYDQDTINGVYFFPGGQGSKDTITSDSIWIGIIEHEINMGRPVIYEGVDTSPTGGGHAWVCDGYDASGNLHMNWGWSGWSDGFFAITNFTTGSGSYAFNPVEYQDALIGIMPKPYPAGINSLSDLLAFKVFPNPAANYVILQTAETNGAASWEFKNLVGQTVMTGAIEGTQTRINTAGLASGVYFVELHEGDKTAVRKLVVGR